MEKKLKKQVLVEQIPYNDVVVRVELENVQNVDEEKWQSICDNARIWLHHFCWKARG